jgi:hypothetical protein
MSSRFPILSFEQLNPGLTSASAIQKLFNQALLNQEQYTANQYQPKNLEEALRGSKLKNSLSEVELQYAPEKARAGINNMNASTGLMGSQTRKTDVETKFAPFKNLVDALKAQQQFGRFGNAYQFRQLLQNADPALRNTIIAQHPEEYSAMVSDLMSKSAQQESSGGSALLNKMMGQLFPQQDKLTLSNQDQQRLANSGLAQQAGMNSPMQQNQSPYFNDEELASELQNNPELLKAMMSQHLNAPNQQSQSSPQNTPVPGQPNLADIFKQAAPQPATLPVNQQMANMYGNKDQENADQLKRAAELSANKKLTTTKTWNQLEGGIQILDMLKDPGFLAKAKSASTYAGALRKGPEFIARLSQENPKALMDYESFKSHDIPAVLNRFKGVEGMGSTDAQRQELHNMYEAMSKASSNPEQFMIQLDLLTKTVERIEKSVRKSATPIFDVDKARPENKDLKSSMQDPLGIR